MLLALRKVAAPKWLLVASTVFVALLVCLIGNNGVVVAGVGLLAAAIALRSLKGGACLVAVMAAFLCWNSVVLLACNVQPTEPRLMLRRHRCDTVAKPSASTPHTPRRQYAFPLKGSVVEPFLFSVSELAIFQN